MPLGEVKIEHVVIEFERFKLIPDDGNLYHIVHRDKHIPPKEVDIDNIANNSPKRLKWGTIVNVTENLDPDARRKHA